MCKRILFMMLMPLVMVSCSKDDDLPPRVPVQDLREKHVEFQLYTDKTFAEERWNEAYVKVELAVIKRDADGNENRIFEKTLDWVHFRDFPKLANKIIEVYDLTYDNNTEVIFVSYGVSTKIDGFLSSEGTSFSLAPEENIHLVPVRL